MASGARELLLEIARCPNVKHCYGTPDRPHPCRQVVFAQNAGREAFHVPEPWSGRIETAPILFVSSNPSFNPREDFPTVSSSDDVIETFFTTRFDFSDQASHYWNVVASIAKDLLGRPPRPGHDYALTEVVRCKSVREIGVVPALDECSGRYLARTLEIAGASVIVPLGKKAREGVARHLDVPDSQIGLHARVTLGVRECAVLMLGHPSGPERKKPTSEEIKELRSRF